ncbi:MAG: hypothetical protein GC161_08590 [Planctomycetaceae bacterium]|nr:hypothetical protein [Planctomycetaceae bacterium]
MRKGFVAAALAAAMVAVLWIVFPRSTAVVPAGPERRAELAAAEPAAGQTVHTDRAAATTTPRSGVVPTDGAAERSSAPSAANFLRLVDQNGRPVAGGRMAAIEQPRWDAEVALDPDLVWTADADGWLPTPAPELVRHRRLVVGAPGFLADRVVRLPLDRELRLEPSQPFAGVTLAHGDDRPLSGVVLEVYEQILTSDRFVPMQRSVSGTDGSIAFCAGPRGRLVDIFCVQGAQGDLDLSLQLIADRESGYQIYLPPPMQVRLRPVDGLSGASLPHLAVDIEGAGELRTNGRGEIEFPLFPDAPHQGRTRTTSLSVSADEYLSTDVTLTGGGSTHDVPLYRGVRLEILVLGADGRPVAGGRLDRDGASFTHNEGDPIPNTPLADFYGPLRRAPEPGLWTMAVRPLGEYRFGFADEQHAPMRFQLTIPAAVSIHRAEFRLEPGASLHGKLVGARHLRGARVAIQSVSPQWSSTPWVAFADDDGHFFVSGLPADEVTLTASHVGPDGTRYTLVGDQVWKTLVAGEQSVEMSLLAQPALRKLRGTVLDATGAPAHDVRVRLFAAGREPPRNDAGRGWPATSTNRNGDFWLEGLEAIEPPFSVRAWTSWSQVVVNFDTWPDEVVLRLPSAARLRTVARDATSAVAIGNAALFYREPGDAHFRAARDGQALAGGEMEWDLPAGPFEVRLGALDHALGPIESVQLLSGQHTSLSQLLEPGTPLTIQFDGFVEEEYGAELDVQLILVEEVGGWDVGCSASEFAVGQLTEPLGAAGFVRFAAVPPGRYRVTWDGAGALVPDQLEIPRGVREVLKVRVGS